MKKLVLLFALVTVCNSAMAEESGWLNSLKNFVGIGESKETSVTTEAPTAQGLVQSLTGSLNIDQAQASGGMGAIMNYVKNNVSTEQFGQLAGALPGVEGLISQMPDISKLSSGSGEGFGGLLNQAAEYSESLKAINNVKKQFEALGLSPEMISQFVSAAQSYLDSEQGQQAKQVLTQGLGKLLG